MSEIILDAFEPTAGCLDPAPPTNPKTPDPCQVTMTFHTRGDATTQFPVITFQRNQDSFALANSHGLEINLGLLRAGGFDEKSGAAQSLFLASVGLFKWIERSYPSFRKKTGYNGPLLTPLAHRLRNFIVAGSLQNQDVKQKQEVSSLLKEMLDRPEVGRNYFKTVLETLLKEDIKGQLLPDMQPRLKWMLEMVGTYEQIQKSFPAFLEKDPLDPWFHALTVPLVAYLATGEGSLDEIQKFMDESAQALRKGNQEGSALYQSLITSMKTLEGVESFKNSKEALERLKRIQTLAEGFVREHRADLLGLSPKDALGKALFFKIQDALSSGAFIDSVRDEMKDAKMGESWLKETSNIREIFNAVLPSLQWEEGAKIPPPGRVKVDVVRLRADLERLIDSHSINHREYLIGSLAMLRHFFGKSIKAAFVSTWVKDRYASVPLEISEAERKSIDKFALSLERGIRKSLKQTNLFLPIGEAALCAAGLVAGGTGLGLDNHGLMVGGSTTAGVGCGALITHYVLPTRNPYLSDSLGGAALGIAAFALSFFLGGNKQDPLAGRNPVTGWGP